MYDELLYKPGIGVEDVIYHLAEFGTALGLDVETIEGKVEAQNFLDLDDIFGYGKFVRRINDHTEVGKFAHAIHGENIRTAFLRNYTAEPTGDEFKTIRIDNQLGNLGNATADVQAENWATDELGGVD